MVAAIASRLREAMGGVAVAALSRRTGIARNHIRHIRDGVHRPMPETIDRIAVACGYRVEWILTGEGERRA